MREPIKFDMSTFSANTDIMAVIDKRIESRFTYTPETLLNAILSHDTKTLREASNSFFHTSGEYRRLIEYRANLLRNDYMLYPTKEYSSKSQKEVGKYIDNQNIRETHYNIALQLMLEGVYYGYERKLGNTYFFQTLDAEFCRSTAFVNGTRMVEFDLDFFKKFRGDELANVIMGMPEEIVAGYKKYIKSGNDKNKRWLLLNSKRARSHAFPDELPPLASVLLDIINLAKYKEIDLLGEEISIYKILVQKIPLNKDGELTLLAPEIEAFHKNLRKLTKGFIDVVTTPCEVDSIDLDDRMSTPSNRVENALNTIYSTAGTPMLLFNTSSGGATALKESIAADMESMLPILKSYEAWYKQRFEEFGDVSKGRMVIKFLPVTEHNKKDFVGLAKDMTSLGFPTKTMLASILEIDDLEDLLEYENKTLKLNQKMEPPKTSYTTANNSGGAEEKDISELTEEGIKTREGEKNDR